MGREMHRCEKYEGADHAPRDPASAFVLHSPVPRGLSFRTSTSVTRDYAKRINTLAREAQVCITAVRVRVRFDKTSHGLSDDTRRPATIID